MKIITGLDFTLKNSSVSLGKFDGIHLGHRFLLQEVLQQKQLQPTVFTFENTASASKIYTQREKDRILEQMGISQEVIFPFNEATKGMSPEEFIRKILIERMDVKHICVGTDFRFGRNREGDIHTLETYQEKYGYSLTTVPKLKDAQGDTISSTTIRSLLENGQLERANELLGAPYFIMGCVCHGNALGRRLAMPTANLVAEPDKKLLPYGAYVTTVLAGDKMYGGLTNIGRKPTVGRCAVGIETYIMDFSEEIYGKEIQVFFHAFLRPEKKFENIEMLQRQLERDKLAARDFFAKKGYLLTAQKS